MWGGGSGWGGKVKTTKGALGLEFVSLYLCGSFILSVMVIMLFEHAGQALSKDNYFYYSTSKTTIL